MASWLPVVDGDGERPRVVDQGLDEDLVYDRPPALVAWGTVDGVPWRIQSAVTAPGPDARWWEHGPVGPELVFMLGRDDEFGGGGVNARLNEGTHLSASVHFFGSHPSIVSWVGVVSNEVTALEVRLEDGDRRGVELHDGAGGFPRIFWFFPPRGARGALVAIGTDGREFKSENLVDTHVHPRSNSGTTVNGFGYRDDGPPPGWPDDATEYGPGEGPRHAEDFHLHEVTFPLYLIHPERWNGYAGLSGSGSSGSDPTNVDFGYFDEPGGSARGMEVVNARPGRRPRARPVRHEEVGIWRSQEGDDDDVVNFAFRFVPHEDQRRFESEFGWPDVGPSRIVGSVELEVASRHIEASLREYRRLPQLRSIGFELPETRVTVFGWALSFEELEHYANALERLELGSELFRAMKDAETRSARRFDELHGHHHHHD